MSQVQVLPLDANAANVVSRRAPRSKYRAFDDHDDPCLGFSFNLNAICIIGASEKWNELQPMAAFLGSIFAFILNVLQLILSSYLMV